MDRGLDMFWMVADEFTVNNTDIYDKLRILDDEDWVLESVSRIELQEYMNNGLIIENASLNEGVWSLEPIRVLKIGTIYKIREDCLLLLSSECLFVWLEGVLHKIVFNRRSVKDFIDGDYYVDCFVYKLNYLVGIVIRYGHGFDDGWYEYEIRIGSKLNFASFFSLIGSKDCKKCDIIKTAVMM